MQSNAQPRTAWHNHLPKSITGSDAWTRMPKSARIILQTIADRCDAPHPDGSLTGCFGSGVALAEAAGVNKATYWRSVTKLCRAGFLVLLGRGGQIRLHGARIRTIANSWGVPGHQGALLQAAVPRENARLVRDVDGRLIRYTVEPGAQAALFPGLDGDVGQSQNRRTQAGEEKCDWVSRKMRLGQSQNATPPSHRPSHGPRDCGVFITGLKDNARTRSRARDGATAPLRSRLGNSRLENNGNTPAPAWDGFHVASADLGDGHRFADLFARAAECGLIQADVEADVDWFFAAAAHAGRLGQNPAALFAFLIRRDLRAVISIADENEGRRRKMEQLGW
jgi:hypothetical protein